MKKNLLFILLIFSGVLCGLMQTRLNMPFLAFVSFAPMMYALQTADGKGQLFKRFCAFFIPYYIVQTAFLVTVYKIVPMSEIPACAVMILCSVMLALWESFLMFLPVYLIRWLKRSPFTDMAVIALLITGGEWLQEHIFFLSFPWSAVWLTVTKSPLLIQSANLLGCRFVTFIILTANGLLAQLVTSDKRIFAVCTLVALQGANISYGAYSLNKCQKLSENSEKLSVMCAQDETEGAEKNNISALKSAKSYISILSENWEENTDLVLLPETAVPDSYDEENEEFRLISDFAVAKKCTVISGCFFDGTKEYNALYACSPEGKISSPYCKQVLVPFGEKIPFAFLFGADSLCECSEKDKILPIKTGKYTIGSSICIESIYPDIVRNQSAKGAEFLCVSTNDSWFGKSGARQQHFRHSIMRAAENRKWLLRAGNCGISAIISPAGEVIQSRSQREKGTVSGEISVIEEKSLYATTGDIFITLPALLTVYAILRRFSKTNRSNLPTKS